MEEIKVELEKIQEKLIKDFNPLAIILFGSYARNAQNKESDIDIAIIARDVDKKMIFIEKQELENFVMKDIDLINLENVDISEGFKYEILMNGVVLYCSNGYKLDLYKLEAFKEYLDLNESRQDIIDRIKQGGTIYGK